MDEDLVFCRDDLIKGGLCLEGVNRVMRRLSPIAAAVPIFEVLPRLTGDEVSQLQIALKLDGDGNGNGYGDGYGYGGSEEDDDE